MVLRKPYALFIKLFKPIHLLLAFLVAYLITIQNKIMSIFSDYIYSNVTVINKVNISKLVSIIPIFVLVTFIAILGIMYKKEKPYKFYVVGILLFLTVIIINVYSVNTLKVLEERALAIKDVKFMHDLSLVNMIIEIVILVFLIVRGMGIDIKSFDFGSDLSKIDISESDREEYEVSINFDSGEAKRKYRKRLRSFKYLYFENKFKINVILGAVVLVIITIIGVSISKTMKQKSEGYIHSVAGINYSVNRTIIINEDYKGKKITDNSLIVVAVNMSSPYGQSAYLKDFNLVVSDISFDPTTKYNKKMLDIGNFYDEQSLDSAYKEYLLVYEIPEKYIDSKMILKYSSGGVISETKLKPKKYSASKTTKSSLIKDEMSFIDSIGDIKFTIDSFDIQNKYKVNYSYCTNDKNCISSIEYIEPTIDKSFDKYLLKLDLTYKNETNLNFNDFYDFFEMFGSIYYEIGDDNYEQTWGFEEVKSVRKNMGNSIFIGVNSDIAKADKIKLLFKTRNFEYEYILK